ncbi:MAG: aminotransferase class V-fold PLP-dependent enzyme [Pirellulales bacterium]|nr:aminotransferase class V-fold PLP-dependent enzyme [Pirellulales bacterium]
MFERSAHDPRPLRAAWGLAPDVVYLNHGSFGPAPRAVIDERQRWFAQLEANPMDFFIRQLDARLDHVRERLARFVGCKAGDLVFVDNATAAMNVVAQSFPLAAGDEVVATDHEYGAVLRLWHTTCERAGAKLVIAELPDPLTTTEELIDKLFAAVTGRTKLLVVSHVTSPTAVVLPIEAICRRAREQGIAVAVDGPHALAMRELDLRRLDCDYYAVSCHKWLCAPFGTGFLYAHPRRQQAIRPAVMSWGHTSRGPFGRWQDEFDWVGTRDPSGILAIPTAIEFLESQGIETFRQYGHELARYAREQLLAWSLSKPLCPDSEAWYGTMAAVEVQTSDLRGLQQRLWERHKIEIAATEWKGRKLIRVSGHLYTAREEIDLLLEALRNDH